MATSPLSVTIRSYQVGFGDCFLLSFRYSASDERHVLMDFGSTGLPEHLPKTHMRDVAEHIRERIGKNNRLHAVVATHRHKDHISGFETKEDGSGPGDIIRALKPLVVVQPWTEDPKLKTNATGPGRPALTGEQRHIAMLASMNDVAESALRESAQLYFAKDVQGQLAFLGEDNIANRSAVKNLMDMAPNVYTRCDGESGLERDDVLPGVRVHVLGPPTIQQTDTIKKMRSRDADEFWHLQARALRDPGASGGGAASIFPEAYVRARGSGFPIDARWLIYRSRRLRGEQLLQIVRILDQQMNNTSLILLFEVGDKLLLFPGDAQLENWQYALGQQQYKDLLARVNLYKVGHHGSLNATPKTLWQLFDNKSKDKTNDRRLVSLMSTMKGKHGHEDRETEVPRRPLVQALKRESSLRSTHDFKAKELYRDTVMDFG